jgi:hypothetical protein
MLSVHASLLLLTLLAAPAPRPEIWTVGRITEELGREIDALQPSAVVRADFARVARRHDLPTDDAMLRQYLRVKTVFEATREAGWWRLAWSVTDREPQSDAIWAAWRTIGARVPRTTATAECDESSALAALLLRRLGVRTVGLFWPQFNHTVAVWKVKARSGREARIVLPTSQVFLDPSDGFDTTAFDPKKQRTIYDYTRSDVKSSDAIPASLGRFFLLQVRRYAAASDDTQRHLRVLRSRYMAGDDSRRLEADRLALERRAVAADRPAVEAFAAELADDRESAARQEKSRSTTVIGRNSFRASSRSRMKP